MSTTKPAMTRAVQLPCHSLTSRLSWFFLPLFYLIFQTFVFFQWAGLVNFDIPALVVGLLQPSAKQPHKCCLSLLVQRMGRKWKVRRLVSWYDDSLIGKEKDALASKAERGTHSVLPISRQIGNCFWESGPQRAWWLFGLTNTQTTNISPSSFLPWTSNLWVRHLTVQNIPGVGSGHNPSCVPSQPLAQPQPTPRLSAVWALLTKS